MRRKISAGLLIVISLLKTAIDNWSRLEFVRDKLAAFWRSPSWPAWTAWVRTMIGSIVSSPWFTPALTILGFAILLLDSRRRERMATRERDEAVFVARYSPTGNASSEPRGSLDFMIDGEQAAEDLTATSLLMSADINRLTRTLQSQNRRLEWLGRFGLRSPRRLHGTALTVAAGMQACAGHLEQHVAPFRTAGRTLIGSILGLLDTSADNPPTMAQLTELHGVVDSVLALM